MSTALRAKGLDDSLYGPTVASAATLCSFAFIAILLRFLARRLDHQKLWYDDYLLIPSVAVTLTCSMVSWATFSNNRIPGNDPLILDAEMTARFLKAFYLYQVLGAIGHTCHKLSILTLLLRWYRPKYRNYTRVVLGSIALLTAWAVAFSLASLFQCRPVNKLWDPDVPGTCTNPKYLVGTIGFSNIGLQFWVLGLLFYRVLRLNLFRTQRGRWTTTFVLGSILVAAGCAMSYFDVVQLMPFFEDQIYSLNGSVMFYLLEINLGVVTACVPVLPPVFQLCCGSRRKQNRDSGDSTKDIKAIEMHAEDLSVELADPVNLRRDPTGRLRAELLDAKVDRGELAGNIPITAELPTYEACIEIDGREIPQVKVSQPSPVPPRLQTHLPPTRDYSVSTLSSSYSPSSSTWASPNSSRGPSPTISRGPSQSLSTRFTPSPQGSLRLSPQPSLKLKALPALPPSEDNNFF